jgi:hypothetical protein
MEIRSPLFPLSPASGQAPRQRAPERGYGEMADQALERAYRMPVLPTGGPQPAEPTLGYGDLLRQARMQRVEESHGRTTGAAENQSAQGRAVGAYREQARLGELGGVELLRLDEFA